ncbi:hypothetical protein [Streptomyces sp. JJ36]|uniref:hypothetical protein n=1 Tax=Streptomyces sp. JJ36 TaxID=2736645 RepID=UPI001F30FD70|nr:hypothetical protein [Streptomyces sp. JJ36]MCF6521767.1 hypothetical protein [Streptomyces sp. JJ36]
MGAGERSALYDYIGVEGRLHQGESDGRAGTETRMSLASSDDDPGWAANGSGDGRGGLSSDRKLWTGVSQGVESLRTNLKKAMTKLDEGQKGLGAGDLAVTGFVSGAAQLSVYQSWDRYLDLVSRECGELTGKLEKAGNDHYKNDEEISAAFQQQRTKPEEPASGGGHPSTGGHPSQGR